MNAPPWPLNPSVGEWFQNWIWNGSRWVCSRSTGIRVLITTFTADGPYQPSPGLVTVVVECIGGGGGGGGASAGSDTTLVVSAGGGGSGGYARKALPAALVQGGVNVTVAQQAVGDGNATSFGAFCVAPGGYASTNNYPQSGFASVPGSGATGGTGDVVFEGNGGLPGFLFHAQPNEWGFASGGQAGAIFGGSAAPVAANGTAADGLTGGFGQGCGGSGGICNQTTAGANGGMGGSGLCIVTEYCWADAASDGEDCVDPRTVNVNARVTMAHDEDGRPGKPGPGPWPGKPPWVGGPGRPPIGPFEGDWDDDGQS